MSHIFDGLQRAERESSGADSPALLVATELLQAAEQTRRAPHSTDERQPGENSIEANPSTGFDDLEQCPVVPVFIPQQNRLVSVGGEESLGAEKFRFLAVRLRQLRQSRPLKKILITSTIPQEGKSTVAANLACTLARRKKQKVLLLEGDLRRPTVAPQFGLGRIPGLCDWLCERTQGINICRLEGLGLWLLPAGAAPQNPLELMQSGKLAPLMNRLDSWFDWVIIDSPPVLPLADASLWSRLADGILLVTRKGITEKQQLQRGLGAIERSKLLGALVNSSTNASHSNYYQRYSSSPTDQSKE